MCVRVCVYRVSYLFGWSVQPFEPYDTLRKLKCRGCNYEKFEVTLWICWYACAFERCFCGNDKWHFNEGTRRYSRTSKFSLAADFAPDWNYGQTARMNMNWEQAYREHQILRLNQTIQNEIISNEHETAMWMVKYGASGNRDDNDNDDTQIWNTHAHTRHNSGAKSNLISFTINFLFE